jgi:hypothetical protein
VSLSKPPDISRRLLLICKAPPDRPNLLDVASYFTDKFAAKGKTVPELIQFMAKKGLKFAPATGGDEAAYSALYNYLVGYALQANQGGGKE